jgi:hypothetical protein
MQKPNNYDKIQASGDFTPISLGGHHLIIKKVEESKTKTGKDMIVVAFDMAPGDSQPGYFSKAFADDIRPDKKWPRAGRQYIVTEDSTGNCSRSFKTFINCVERSNNGFVTQWGDTFAQQFKGKRIGGVFGEVENEYNGKTTMRHELRWFCDDNKADSANVPQPKYLQNSNATTSAPATSANDFVNIAGTIEEEEIPF